VGLPDPDTQKAPGDRPGPFPYVAAVKISG
jgi:hypothetical protein